LILIKKRVILLKVDVFLRFWEYWGSFSVKVFIIKNIRVGLIT